MNQWIKKFQMGVLACLMVGMCSAFLAAQSLPLSILLSPSLSTRTMLQLIASWAMPTQRSDAGRKRPRLTNKSLLFKLRM